MRGNKLTIEDKIRLQKSRTQFESQSASPNQLTYPPRGNISTVHVSLPDQLVASKAFVFRFQPQSPLLHSKPSVPPPPRRHGHHQAPRCRPASSPPSIQLLCRRRFRRPYWFPFSRSEFGRHLHERRQDLWPPSLPWYASHYPRRSPGSRRHASLLLIALRQSPLTHSPLRMGIRRRRRTRQIPDRLSRSR